MRSPLAVRISDGVRDQHVTRFVKGLRFTKTAPGGHHSASVQFDLPDNVLGDLGPADRLFIYDGRNARTVWDGYVENPGRTAVLGGGRYDVSAMGGVVLASDNARPVVFVSRDLSHSHWRKASDVASATTDVDQAAVPGSGPAFKAQFPPGTPVGGLAQSGILNAMLLHTAQPVHRVSTVITSGKDDTDFRAFLCLFSDADGTSSLALTAGSMSTTPAVATFAINPADTYFGLNILGVAINRFGGATTVADDLTWSVFSDVVLRPCLKSADGAYVVAELDDAVYAHEVVAHLVGSDTLAATADSIESTSFPITNLAYLEGAKPFQILDDLSLYEPDRLWEILETGPDGKHRFAYRAWPTTPRYEISGREFTESGGELDLCNRIAVSWKDAAGAEQTTVRTALVPALGSRVRDAEPITLPDSQGSQANAERIGDEVLAALNTPTRSGTAVIRQPIHDTLTGQMAMPWEIEPGYVVRVRDRGIDLRMTEMTYDDTNCSASLTLGTPTLTQAQRLARLSRR